MERVYKAYDGTQFKTRKKCEEYEAQTCKYYHSVTETVATTDFEQGYQMALKGYYDTEKTIEKGYCWGQKNAPECFCNGCIEKCTEKHH